MRGLVVSGLSLLVGLFGVVATASAYGQQPAPDPALSRAKQRDVAAWTAQLISDAAVPKQLANLDSQIAFTAARRRDALLQIAQRDPRRAIRLAMSPQDRDRVPEPARSQIEKRVIETGMLHIRHVDRADGTGAYNVELVTAGQTIPVLLGAQSRLHSGDQVILNGIEIGGGGPLVADEATIQAVAPSGSVGAQRTALLLVSTSDAPPHPNADKAATASIVYSPANPQSARSFYTAASYGQTTIVGASGDGGPQDIYGPYVMNLASSSPGAMCDSSTQQQAALAAVGQSVPFNAYDRVVILWNIGPGGCGGWGSVGQFPFSLPTGVRDVSLSLVDAAGLVDNYAPTTFNAKVGGLFLHEYGHNLGMEHAGALTCGPGLSTTADCGGVEYGDPTDVMGYALDGQPNSVQKELLGWLGGREQVATVSGYYSLSALENPGAANNVLKVPRSHDANGNTTGYYYLDYRKPLPIWQDWLGRFFGAGAAYYTSGVLIHVTADDGTCVQTWCPPDFSIIYGDDSMFVDSKPNSQAQWQDLNDAPLLPGQWFDDQGAGVSFMVTDASTTSATILVSIGPSSPTIRTMVNPPESGTVTGGGIIQRGQAVTLTANPYPGYQFSGWYEARLDQLYPDPYVFTATSDRFLEAEFVPAPPPNDAWSSGIAVSGIPLTYTESTWGAGVEPGEPSNCASSTVGGTVWFKYTAPTTGPISLSVSSDQGFPVVSAFTGSGVGSLSAVPGATCSYSPQGPGATPPVSINAQAGVTYSIQVGGFGGAAGVVTLNVTPGPALAASANPTVAIPGSWWTGQTQMLNVQIQNVGSATLAAAGPNATHLSVSFGSASDVPQVGWTARQLFDLPTPIAAGATVNMAVPVTAPIQTGSYVVRLGVVEDGVGWSPLISKAGVTVLVNCATRPAVSMAVAPGGGQLSVRVSAGSGGALRSITFGSPSPAVNAIANIGTQLGISTGVVYFPAGTRVVSFAIRRAAPGLAATLPFTVADDCGVWPTFAGGGVGSF